MKNSEVLRFPTLYETINNNLENIYDPKNHILCIVPHLRSEFKRRFNDFKILEPVARFILNP